MTEHHHEREHSFISADSLSNDSKNIHSLAKISMTTNNANISSDVLFEEVDRRIMSVFFDIDVVVLVKKRRVSR
jgi:hypothetical protein